MRRWLATLAVLSLLTAGCAEAAGSPESGAGRALDAATYIHRVAAQIAGAGSAFAEGSTPRGQAGPRAQQLAGDAEAAEDAVRRGVPASVGAKHDLVVAADAVRAAAEALAAQPGPGRPAAFAELHSQLSVVQDQLAAVADRLTPRVAGRRDSLERLREPLPG